MNTGSWIVLLVLIGIVVLIVVSMVRKRKAGKSISCEGCSSECHCSEGGTCQSIEEMLTKIDQAPESSPTMK